jgi:hypothetical protein
VSGREPYKGHREIALPLRIARIGLRDALGNGEAVLERFQRAREIALRLLHIANLFVGDRQIAWERKPSATEC